MNNDNFPPLISVIVPIYNVELYLRKCLDSLKNQSMKQIEVICIDDGSTDRSGAIADEYVWAENQWPRFRIFHTDNRGLSAARNKGIDETQTEWLMFVDSDDWVEPEFCKIPYNIALEHNADLVIIQADKIKRGKEEKDNLYSGPVGIVDEMTAHEYGGKAAWNKLYKKCLFNNIRYPERRIAEDVATTHKIVHEAKRIIVLKDYLYHYCPRRGSITHTHTKKNKRDTLVSEMERVYDLISYGYPEQKLKNDLCGPAIGYLASIKDSNDELYEKAVSIVNKYERIPENMTKKQKIAMKVWRIDRRLFYLMSRIAGRMKAQSQALC